MIDYQASNGFSFFYKTSNENAYVLINLIFNKVLIIL